MILSITLREFNLWIRGYFDYLMTPFFTVGSTTFSFYDVLIGGVTLTVIGFGIGKVYGYIDKGR